MENSPYGLIQSPRDWYNKMVDALLQMRFEKTAPKNGVFLHKSKKGKCLWRLYVDDCIIVGSSNSIFSKVNLFLLSRFEMKCLDMIIFRFLWIEMVQNYI